MSRKPHRFIALRLKEDDQPVVPTKKMQSRLFLHKGGGVHDS